MSDIVGIDLGTTNSLIGVMEAGFPILFADENGQRLVPSVVHFPTEGEPLVGAAAQRMQAIAPDRTVFSVKRLMGARGTEVSEDAGRLPYRVIADKPGNAAVEIGSERYTPEHISSLILARLRSQAERALGRAITRAVITVPAYFNDGQRNATRRAGELAGLTVERIVSEPTAAALAYGLNLKENSKIAVYDFGGGTFDVSILELTGGVFEVLATNGNTRLGGDDIDAALISYVTGKTNPPLSPAASARWREAVIAAKHTLSTQKVAEIEIPFSHGAESVYRQLSREELEEQSRPVVERTRSHCLRVLADAKLNPGDLDEVILAGGSTRMPLVRQLVRDVFHREPNTSQNPDEAVALGATIQAGILSGAVRDVVLLDITPLSLGIETFGGLMNVIIPRNSTIPIKAGEMFTTAVHQQRSMAIKVLQGEREMACDNWPLGQFEIEFESAPKGIARVGVQFEIDSNGILHVLARDIRTGQDKVLEIESAVDVSDDAVEAMLAESLEHALEDVSERRWTELQLKAHEMLSAVEKAIGLAGHELGEAERAEIEGRAADLRAALTTREVARLQRASGALEQATEVLAAIVVERAMRGAKGATLAE